MTTHPLGDVDQAAPDAASIVNEILDLNDFLATEIRLAVKQAAFYTRADLEAPIEGLNAELNSLTDSQGRPLPVVDAAVGDGERSAPAVAQELLAVQREYSASRRVILMQQLDQDEWTAFQARWKEALAEDPPYPPAFYEDLITRSALKPKMTVEQLREFRKRVGAPAFDEIWRAAWDVNTQSGVSIPKSLLSSAVLRQSQPG